LYRQNPERAMEQTRLTSLILSHWRTYRPTMVAEMEREGKLAAAEETVTDILFEMISVHKMDYLRAWEEAMSMTLLPEE
jgi:hypothetical protein